MLPFSVSVGCDLRMVVLDQNHAGAQGLRFTRPSLTGGSTFDIGGGRRDLIALSGALCLFPGRILDGSVVVLCTTRVRYPLMSIVFGSMLLAF